VSCVLAASSSPSSFSDPAYAGVVMPALGGWLSGDRGAYEYLAKSMAGFLRRREYERALVVAGFSRVHGFDLTLGVASIVRAEVPS